MHRRAFLATATAAATAATAGCMQPLLDGADDTPTPTATPTPTPELYRRSEREDLILVESDFDQPAERQPPDYNPDFRVFIVDEQLAVANNVRIRGTLSQAEQAIEEATNRLRSPNEFSVGDEAYWSEGQDFATVVFRHRNALSQIRAGRESGLEVVPALGVAQSMADAQFARWRR